MIRLAAAGRPRSTARLFRTEKDSSVAENHNSFAFDDSSWQESGT
jgi:hypothetical protein